MGESLVVSEKTTCTAVDGVLVNSRSPFAGQVDDLCRWRGRANAWAVINSVTTSSHSAVVVRGRVWCMTSIL